MVERARFHVSVSHASLDEALTASLSRAVKEHRKTPIPEAPDTLARGSAPLLPHRPGRAQAGSPDFAERIPHGLAAVHFASAQFWKDSH